MEENIQIRNKKTGEVKTISKSQASQYGIQSESGSQGFDLTDLIPLATSIGGGALGSVFAPGVGTVGGYVGGGALGERLRQHLKGEQADYGKVGFQGATGLIPFGLGKVFGKALPFLKLGGSALTKGGLARKTTEIASRASLDKGATVPVQTVTKDITETATKKLGSVPDVQNAIKEFIAGITPSGVESIPSTIKFNPTQLLDLRRQTLAREGRGLLQKLLQGSDISSKVANIGRGVLSSTLHELTPETIPPDKLFTLYSKIGGDIPALLLKGGGIAGALALLKQLFGNVVSENETGRSY